MSNNDIVYFACRSVTVCSIFNILLPCLKGQISLRQSVRRPSHGHLENEARQTHSYYGILSGLAAMILLPHLDPLQMSHGAVRLLPSRITLSPLVCKTKQDTANVVDKC